MIVDRACARSRRCAIESVTALGAAYKTLHDAGRDGPPRRMSLVGLEPFQRERKGLFADDRRHGDRDHWDRNRARPAVGEGFPLLLFRLQSGFTFSPSLPFPSPPL